MKKMLAVTLAAAMTAGLLAGCSGGGSTGGGAAKAPETTAAQETTAAAAGGEKTDETKAEAAAPAADASKYEVTEPITIQWWHALEDQYSQTVQDVVDGFNSSQDLITVEPVYVGNYAAVNEALVAAHAAGTGLPAITVANTPYVAEYGAGGLTEDLTPYIEATGFEIDDFGKGLVDATSYEDKQVALPFLISTQVMYYNKDIADELGVTIPEKFDDMDQFLEAVSVVNNGTTERYGTIIPGWDQWYFETFYLNKDVKIINDDRISTDLDSEAATGLVNKFKEWCDKGYIYWANGEDASSIMRQNFIDKKAFSVCHTSSLYNTYVDKCDFEVGMSWLPAGDTKNQEIGGCVLLIPSKNDQATKNAAWQFLSYLCSKEVNMKWAKETGYIPTRNSVLHTDEGVKFLEEKPAFQCIFDNLDLINPRIQHPGWSQLATIWKNYMAEMMIEDVDIPSKIEDMTEEINEVLEDS
ncbi:MAG: extracellular solute-binding protein [Lachnospiraceae bacterium]|nr:extracellular solute-binding protein [Lachnospiraceae bacterium]